MKNLFRVVTLATVFAFSSVAGAAQNVQKIAVVFPSKIMKESPQLEKIKNKLEAEFKSRIANLQTLEKQITSLESKLKRDAELMSKNDISQLQRQRAVKLSEYKIEREAFNDDNRRRESEEQQKSWTVIRQAINSVANKKGYDLVLNGEQIFFAKPGFDISDSVIKEISKK